MPAEAHREDGRHRGVVKPDEQPAMIAGSHHPGILREPHRLSKVRPLFEGEVTKLEGLLDRNVRSRVERVMLIYGGIGLSYPLINGAILAQLIPENFPNADFVDCTGPGIMQLVRRQRDRNLTIINNMFQGSSGGLEAGKEKSIAFYLGEIPFPAVLEELRDSNCLTVCLPSFGGPNAGRVHAITGEHYHRFPAVARASKQIQSIKDAQTRVLSRIGLENLPELGQPLVLTPDKFSSELVASIDSLGREVRRKGGSRPFIFINNLKRHKSHFSAQEELADELKKLVRDMDATFIVNHGGRQWEYEGDEMRKGAIVLEEALRKAPGGSEKVLPFRQSNLVEFAALIHLADASGGCFVDVHGGGSFISDWLGAREVVISLDEWDHLIRERKNLRTVRWSEVRRRLAPSIEELTART